MLSDRVCVYACACVKMFAWQQRAAGGRSAVGALFAKALEYEVTSRPSTNSSVILTLDIPGPTTKVGGFYRVFYVFS